MRHRARSRRGCDYAYRELGPKGGIPVIFFVHLAATLDNWDPRIIDPIARQHRVMPSTTAAWERPPEPFSTPSSPGRRRLHVHHRVGFDTIDILSFSLGGMVAQALVIKHPDASPRLILPDDVLNVGHDLGRLDCGTVEGTAAHLPVR